MSKPNLIPLIQLIERQTRALGISEREAGRRVGSVGMIANIKKGSTPATDRLFALAQVLRIDAGELQEAMGGYPMGTYGPGAGLSDNSQKSFSIVPSDSDFVTAFAGNLTQADLASDYVIGEVQAGHWLEAAEWPRGDWMPVIVPIDPAYEHLPRFGLLVRGPSMNQLYPDGSVLICVKLIDLNREPISGERVIVHRTRGGTIVEATVKEYVERDGHKRLIPRSDHPDHQTPLELTAPGHDGPEETVTVTALVIGSYRPERPFAKPRRPYAQ